MIMIYSADPATGILYTDPQKRAYIDAEILLEKKISTRSAYLKDVAAREAGYSGWDHLATFARCRGVTADTLDKWYHSGALLANVSVL